MIDKKYFSKGFTLIELMIVIVILGILMGTILPRLTGAQARARDTARQADMNSISQALITYKSDYGKFPGANATVYCLGQTGEASWTPTGGTAQTPSSAISSYMKGKAVPTTPTGKEKVSSCTGYYFYKPLSNRGQANNSFILVADMETFQKANVVTADFAGTVTGLTKLDLATVASSDTVNTAITSATQPNIQAAETDASNGNAASTVFALLGE